MKEGVRDAARALERILAHEGGPASLNAFLSIAREADLTDAAPTGMLSGAAVAVKDNLATTGLPTTCASKLLDGYVSPFESTAVRKLREAGGIVVGKTNMDEFGMGSSTENSAFGPTLNPLDRSRVPGGSSGGSAAAVAGGYVTMALGSDTGGSVRQPAAFCGVVGIKPTYGRVSRYGLVAFASSLDQVGTLGRRVHDAALLLQAVSGHDPRDATSVDRPVPDLSGACSRGVEGMVVGVPREYVEAGLGEGVAPGSVDDALARLRGAGARVREVSLPHAGFAIPAYYVLAPAEASSNLARFDGIRYGRREGGEGDLEDVYALTRTRGFGDEVKRRIVLGTHALSAGYQEQYYGRAQRARRRIADDLRTVFHDGIDVLFSPTTPGSAFPLGERLADPMAMYLSDVFTVTANLAGIPALSVPIGMLEGLPVGGQVMAPWWEEEAMVAVGAALEASFSEERP